MREAIERVIEIPLTKGKMAIIDGSDYDLICGNKWTFIDGYAARNKVINGKKTRQFMHRIIMDCPYGMVVDHINGNKLDNRKCNMRICTMYENSLNSKPHKTKKYTNHKGVFWNKKYKGWRAMISYNRKKYHLGSFRTEIEAAIAYNTKATELFGEYARLNDLSAGAS